MNAVACSQARGNLARTMDKVCDDHAPIIITCKSRRSVVMISLEDYQALEETAYLLRSPKNARRLLESIVGMSSAAARERIGESTGKLRLQAVGWNEGFRNFSV